MGGFLSRAEIDLEALDETSIWIFMTGVSNHVNMFYFRYDTGDRTNLFDTRLSYVNNRELTDLV